LITLEGGGYIGNVEREKEKNFERGRVTICTTGEKIKAKRVSVRSKYWLFGGGGKNNIFVGWGYGFRNDIKKSLSKTDFFCL
jgi:hypothetical protein